MEEYATAELPRDDILLALDSLSDSNSYIVANRLPVRPSPSLSFDFFFF